MFLEILNGFINITWLSCNIMGHAVDHIKGKNSNNYRDILLTAGIVYLMKYL